MPTYLWWILGNSALQTLANIALIPVIVHYAREGAHNAGKLEVHEALMDEARTIPMNGRG